MAGRGRAGGRGGGPCFSREVYLWEAASGGRPPGQVPGWAAGGAGVGAEPAGTGVSPPGPSREAMFPHRQGGRLWKTTGVLCFYGAGGGRSPAAAIAAGGGCLPFHGNGGRDGGKVARSDPTPPRQTAPAGASASRSLSGEDDAVGGAARPRRGLPPRPGELRPGTPPRPPGGHLGVCAGIGGCGVPPSLGGGRWKGVCIGREASEWAGTDGGDVFELQDFKVGNLLGKGSFAGVYRAVSLKTGLEVAIKMVRQPAEEASVF